MTDSHPLTQKFIDEAARSGNEPKVREGFARKLAQIAMDNPVVNLVREAYRYMADLRVPVREKVVVIAALSVYESSSHLPFCKIL
ncbi:MAG: hypothetical protein O6918_13445 [Deltaproteobacteria bacterium]|nr:hypothetical protein [Deltaproteobacteria bacterium]